MVMDKEKRERASIKLYLGAQCQEGQHSDEPKLEVQLLVRLILVYYG